MKQVGRLLQQLEQKLAAYFKLLPIMDRRRGLVNAAGSALKILFGTATMADLHTLHESVDRLHENEKDIVHSVNEQLTYIKKVQYEVRFDTESVKLLSDKVKNMMLDSQKWKDETEWYIHLLNFTLYNQSSILMHIRQLEFGLLQLQQDITSF
jgi:hypothetical protein